MVQLRFCLIKPLFCTVKGDKTSGSTYFHGNKLKKRFLEHSSVPACGSGGTESTADFITISKSTKMKSTIKILCITLLTLGAVSCTNNDQAEQEELYIDSPGGDDQDTSSDRDKPKQ